MGTATRRRWLVITVLALVVVGLAWAWRARTPARTENAVSTVTPPSGKVGPETVHVATDQAEALDIGPPEHRSFDQQQQAIGAIDFNQDKAVPVYTAYQGRIARVLVRAGEDVKAGQVLYTVAAPDIAQAASTLVSTAGALRASNETLRRAKALASDDSIPQREFQQNQADQQTAEANYNAARKTLSLFGLGASEIKAIETDHKIDIELPVRSPIAGRVTARSAQVGLLTQPGVAPAPMTVADISRMWMVASVPESEFARYKLGMPVNVRVQAWPDKVFSGRVSYLGDSVDINTRRFVVRAEVADPSHQLLAQMLASFSFKVGESQTSIALPTAAVVRETSGDTAVWVLTAREANGPRLVRRKVQTGISTDGWVQVTQGLQAGDSVVRRNALFVSNLYEAGAD